MAEIKKINTELQPIDKLLDTSGDAGTSGQILSTTGSGTNWIDNTGIGGGTVTGSGAATRVAFWSSSSALSSNADLYWDNTNDRLGIGTTSPTSQVHIKNTSGDNRGLMIENTVTTSYAELSLKAAREFRIGTGGSGTSANAASEFYVYDATTGGTAGHVFAIDSAGDVQARRERSNTVGDVALSIQPSDSTIHYGFRIDQTANTLNLDEQYHGNLMSIDISGNATFSGDVFAAENVGHTGDTDTKMQFGTNDLKLKAGGATHFHAASDQVTTLYSGNATTLTLDTSQNATFAGTILAGGGGGYSYLNPVITADSDADTPKSIVINNQYNGSSAESKFVVATYGNSWHIGMGSSTHTYGNDLTFTTDASTSNSPKLRIATNGNATFAAYVSGTRFQGVTYPYTTYIGHEANATTTYIQAGSTAKTEIELSGGDTNSNIIFKTPTSGNVTTTALTLDTSQNATFTGNVNVTGTHDVIIANGSFTSSQSSTTAPVARFTYTGVLDYDFTFPDSTTLQLGVNQATTKTFKLNNAGSGDFNFEADDATFAGQAFATTATSSGDGSSTLTTKGYVDGLITGATIFRGTWDPDVSLNSGYGNPNLSTETHTSGYYYICSEDGVATPNGTGCEPDSWHVGDWVVWNSDIIDCAETGTGAWQKIDNTSVLSGIGTGQTVALWEGASSVTDSETLGNAPLTFSTNDATFAGNIALTGNVDVNAGEIQMDDNYSIQWGGNAILKHTGSATNIGDNSSATTLVLSGGNATFAGTVTFNDHTYHPDQVKSYFGTGSDAEIQFDGSHFYVDNSVGTTYIRNTGIGGSGIIIRNSTIGDIQFDNEFAGNILFNTTNIERMRIDSSGIVTITNAATYALKIANTDAYNSGENGGIVFNGKYTAGGNTTDMASIAGGKENTTDGDYGGKLTFSTRTNSGVDTERMRIDSSGNVGIGTTSPDAQLEIEHATGAELRLTRNDSSVESGDIIGTINYYSHDADGQHISSQIQGRADDTYGRHGYLIFGTTNVNSTDAVEKMRIAANGNVGIGEPSPSFRLETNVTEAAPSDFLTPFSIRRSYATSSGTDMYTGMVWRDENTIQAGIYANRTNSASNYESDLNFYTNSGSSNMTPVTSLGTAKMTILSDGNVGIGTTSPSHTLDVSGTSTTGIVDVASFVNPVNAAGTGHGARIILHSTTDAGRGVAIASASESNYAVDNSMLFYTSTSSTLSEKMRIDSSGNVGIGEIAPATLLSNTATRIANADGLSTHLSGITWEVDGQGYAAAISNLETDASQHAAGLLVEIAGTDATDKILDLESGGVNRFRMLGTGAATFAGDVTIDGTLASEGSGNNITYKWRTPSSTSWSGGIKNVKFGRIYWTPAHWANGPVINITIQGSYYEAVDRKYVVKAGFGDTNPIIQQTSVIDEEEKIALYIGATTSAGYDYSSQPVYYADLNFVCKSYMVGWAIVESQIAFLTANPTTTWGGIVMDAALTEPDSAVSFPTNYDTFFTGDISLIRTGSGDAGTLLVQGGEGADAVLQLYADDADNTSDKWSLTSQASTSDLIIKSNTSAVLTLSDGSLGASFAGNVSLTAGVLSITSDGSNAVTLAESGNGDFTIDAADDIRLDAGGGDIVLRDDSIEFARLSNDSNNFKVVSKTGDLELYSETSNSDILFKGVDSGNGLTALTLDMSEAGNATFNNVVYASDGNKGAPTYSFTSDTNTGMYRDSADTVKFTAGGGDILYLAQDGITAHSNIVFAAGTNLELYVDPSSSQTSGTIIKIWSDNVTYGLCYTLREPGAGDGQWEEATVEDDETYATNLLGIAVGTGATSSLDDGMLINGIFHDSAHGFTIGAPLYLSVDGGLSNSAPTGSGEYVRVVGYAISDDEIYFDPDKTWILLD